MSLELRAPFDWEKAGVDQLFLKVWKTRQDKYRKISIRKLCHSSSSKWRGPAYLKNKPFNSFFFLLSVSGGGMQLPKQVSFFFRFFCCQFSLLIIFLDVSILIKNIKCHKKNKLEEKKTKKQINNYKSFNICFYCYWILVSRQHLIILLINIKISKFWLLCVEC